jgi:hypothetical protein
MDRMYDDLLIQNRTEDHSTIAQKPLADLRAAQALLRRNRPQGLEALNQLFRSGTVPQPLNGRYAGELIALDIASGFTQFFQWLANAWMPWLGKTFQAAQESGDNIFTKDSYLLARVFNPLYQGFRSDTPETYRAFSFRTYMAPGLVDSDLPVLKIDYNLKENPALTIRRVLDELVQVEDDVFLGKAHLRWWSGGWQAVAYFTLSRDRRPDPSHISEMTKS